MEHIKQTASDGIKATTAADKNDHLHVIHNQLNEYIYHPVFTDAVAHVEITWKLACARCGAVHRFNTETTQLDPCCSKPTFNIRRGVQHETPGT